MAVQYLGDKKVRRCSEILGEPVRCAVTRGGWKHYVAECWTETGRYWVNYKTGNWKAASMRNYVGTWPNQRQSTTPPP